MAYIIKSLKEKFPELYNMLLKNQKLKDLIFICPNKQLVDKGLLADKSFYFAHIFQKSKFDPSLYTNFQGKVLKLINDKTFKTYLGWKKDMTINITEPTNYNEDGLLFFQIDGICIEGAADVEKIKTDKQSFPLKKCLDSSEYIKYYSQYDLPKYSNFQIGIKAMKSFIFSIKNNFLLIKGHEEFFFNIFKEKMPKFISAFEIIFKRNSVIAREYVDSYIFLNLHDIIIQKLESFYSNDFIELKAKLEENIEKYGILELNLDKSLLNYDFTETFDLFYKLKKVKTFFEKTNCLIEINSTMIKEARIIYEKINEKKLEVQGDNLNSLWIHVLAQYIYKNEINFIYLNYLFFKYFKISKGFEENDYIINNFVGAIELFQNELLNIENNIEQKPYALPYKVVSFE